MRGARAKQWRLVDDVVKPQQFADEIRRRSQQSAARSERPEAAEGVELTALQRVVDPAGYHYEFVDVQLDAKPRRATITVRAPSQPPPADLTGIVKQGANWWPLQMARELDDAILMLRTNQLELGIWILKTQGDAEAVIAADASLLAHREHWFVRETIGMLRRTLARLDVTSRSLFALIEKGSCFAGTLLEIALAADRSYMQHLEEDGAPSIQLTEVNFGLYPAVHGTSRIQARFYDEETPLAAVRAALGRPLMAADADALGLITAAPMCWTGQTRSVWYSKNVAACRRTR